MDIPFHGCDGVEGGFYVHVGMGSADLDTQVLVDMDTVVVMVTAMEDMEVTEVMVVTVDTKRVVMRRKVVVISVVSE